MKRRAQPPFDTPRFPGLRLAMFAAALVSTTAVLVAQSAATKTWDDAFRAIPQPGNIRGYVEHISARPHHVGSAAGKANAEWILARFKGWGWQAGTEQFDVLFPRPKERRVELVEPTKFTAALEEPTVADDPTSG